MEPIPRKEAPVAALAAGSNCIPVFWYSLFDGNCLVDNEVTLQDGRVERYPYLLTSTSDARKRCLQRRAILDLLAPGTHAIVAEQWIRFLCAVEQPFIHLDAAELWMMMEPASFESHLQNCLQAYDLPSVKGQFGKDDLWLGLLDTAQIEADDMAGTVTANKLAGYSWGGRHVPWL